MFNHNHTRLLVVLYLCIVLSHVVKVSTAPNIYSYPIHDSDTTQGNANDDCNNRGMNLPVIKSEDENDELKQSISNAGISASWLGLTIPEGSQNPADYRWSDGTALTWDDWRDGEPSNMGTDNCVEIIPGQGWRSRNCNNKGSYFCQELLNPTSENITRITSFLSSQHFFTRLPNHSTTGEALAALQSSSLTKCFAECLHTARCDIVSVTRSGWCVMFAAVSLQINSTSPEDVYQKTTVA